MGFKFVPRSKGPFDMVYNPGKETTSFYQICGIPDKNNKKNVRKIMINEMGDIISVDIKSCSPKKVKKFIEQNPPNKYNIYPTHDITIIDLPNPGAILSAKSSLLNNENESIGYLGYASIY